MIRLLYFVLVGLSCSAEVTYRIRLTANESNRVVVVSAEQYVAAVLAGEASTFQNEEALKAMAIAARSYAARLRGRHTSEGFDFCATTHCQRVELQAVTSRLTLAAQATAGEVLWFQHQPAFSVYTRNCGGETESGSAVWPGVQASYLRVHSDPYCIRRGLQPWIWSETPQRIAAALRGSGVQTPEALDGIAVAKRTASGRATMLLLNGRTTAWISASSLRFALGRELGWNTVRSSRYEVQSSGGRIHFRGTGEGHGVGLCQLGADEMAAIGFSSREILAFYYPGTTLATNARDLQWTRLGGERIAVFTVQPDVDRKVLPLAEDLLRDWKSRLHWVTNHEIIIRVYPDVDSFRNATSEPGWVAAKTSGWKVDIQPTNVLDTRGVLRQTLRHEVLHALVETHAAPGLPVWFREGVVEYLARGVGDQAATSRQHVRNETSVPGEDPDHDLLQRENRAMAERGYAASETRVHALMDRYGVEAVLTWVVRGLPDEVRNSSESSAAMNSR